MTKRLVSFLIALCLFIAIPLSARYKYNPFTRKLDYYVPAADMDLGDLADVTLTALASGAVFYYDGAAWVNLPKGANGEFLSLAVGIPAWAAIPAEVITFLGLTDTPVTYAGKAGQLVRVNAGANALEFFAGSPLGTIIIADGAGGWTKTENYRVSAAGAVTLGSWTGTAIANLYIAGIDQDLLQASSPTFNDLTISVPVNIYALSHNSFADYAANRHLVLPNTLANVLSDHNLAVHTVLGLFDQSSDVDHNATTNYAANQHVVLPGTIANVLSDHTLLAHTTLGLFDASSDVDHDLTTNYDANKHIDHTGVSISSSGLISGGGTIDGNQTLTLTEGTIEGAIDTLANLTSIQGQTVTFSGSLNVEANSNINQDLTTDATAVQFASLGIATATVPHGAIGVAKFAIDGTDGSAAGPHVQFTTATDDYPLLQIFPWSHDNIALNFDSYHDGSWRSSDAGSNFRIYKLNDELTFDFDMGVPVGNVVPWHSGIVMDASGNVSIEMGHFALKATNAIRFYDNGNYVGLRAPALTANTVWNLPVADGPDNEVLGTDGSRNLIWRTHDEIAAYVANEHIDWTSTASNFNTSGTVTVGSIIGPAGSALILNNTVVQNVELFVGTAGNPLFKIWGKNGEPNSWGSLQIDSGGQFRFNATNWIYFDKNTTFIEDVFMTWADAADHAMIAQTSVTGTENQPLIYISDDRTGETVDEAIEATLRINADGPAYALYIQDGDTLFEEDFFLVWNDAADHAVISQPTVTGTEDQPLIFINDDRTGATANEASEATIYLDADGAYALYIADGDFGVEDWIKYDATSYSQTYGYQAGNALLVGGTHNVLVGYQAGLDLTSGDENVFIGKSAGQNITTTVRQIFIGPEAGVGDAAGMTGVGNIGIGYKAGYSMNSGYENVFIGHLAGESLTSGNNNFFLGYLSGRYITTGRENVFIGSGVGMKVGATGLIGNVFIGAGSATLGVTSAQYNTAVGMTTAQDITSGYNNVFIGKSAGANITDGHSNVFVGYAAGILHTRGQGNVFIGNYAGGAETGLLHNKLFIDNSNTATPLIYGEFDNDLVTINGLFGYGTAVELTIDGAGDVTATRSYHSITVNGGTGSGADDLDTIAGGGAGQIIIIYPKTSGVNDTVTVKDAVDNIQCAGDFAMDHVNDRMTLIYDGANWCEISRSDND